MYNIVKGNWLQVAGAKAGVDCGLRRDDSWLAGVVIQPGNNCALQPLIIDSVCLLTEKQPFSGMLASMRVRWLLIIFLFLSGCAAWPVGPTPVPAAPPTADPDRLSAPQAPIPPAGTNRRTAVEERPRYGLTLGFDAIAPIYEPVFVSAAESRLAGEELVIGVAWGGEAKAYPIRVLNFREMVNDELAGVPTLVTW